MFDLTTVSPVWKFMFSIIGKARVKKHHSDKNPPTFPTLSLIFPYSKKLLYHWLVHLSLLCWMTVTFTSSVAFANQPFAVWLSLEPSHWYAFSETNTEFFQLSHFCPYSLLLNLCGTVEVPVLGGFVSLGTVPYPLLALLSSSVSFSLPFTWTLHDGFMTGKSFDLTLVKEKIILRLVEIIRKTVFKGIAIGCVKTVTVGKMRLNPEYKRYIVKELIWQGDGGWKIIKSNY